MTRRRVFGLAVGLSVLAGACVPGVRDPSQGEPFGPPSSPPSVPRGAPSSKAGPPPVFDGIVTSGKAARPIVGGTLLALSDGRTAVAADPDRDRIFVVDYAAQKVLADIALSPGDEPGRLVADDEGRVHVALRSGGAVVTLLPGPWHLEARRPVCVAPRGIAFDPATKLLHVACAEGELVSLPSAPEGAPVRRLALDTDLRDVVVDGDVLVVSRFRSAEVLTVGSDGTVTSRFAPLARKSMRLAEKGMSFEATPVTLAPAVAWKMVALRPGQTLLLHQRALADEVPIEQPGGYGGDCGGIVESAVSAVNPLDGRNWPSPPLSRVALAVDIAVSPGGERVAVVAPGNAHSPISAQLQEIPTSSVYNQASSCTPVTFGTTGAGGGPAIVPGGGGGSGGTDGGPAPDSGAIDDELGDPVLYRQPIGEATAVTYDRRGHLLVQTREPAAIEVVTAPRRVVLTRESRADVGHAIFHANAGSGLACASCHPEGGDDGRVWKFVNAKGQLELRRTQNLRGGIMATAPFHWNGDLKNLSSLMSEIFVRRMNGPTLPDELVSRLSSWMDTIPALPRRGAVDPDAVERGRLVFTTPTVGCATCHTGALLTNNNTVDVGTGGPLQVPSLRGLSWRAPFMHDGCAGTVGQRFTLGCGGGDRHGVTSRLGSAQLADLAAYLQTL